MSDKNKGAPAKDALRININFQKKNDPKPTGDIESMQHNTTNQKTLQFVSTTSRLDLLEGYFFKTMQICDECALPLRLYRSDTLDTYTSGRAGTLRDLCDKCSEDFGFQGVTA